MIKILLGGSPCTHWSVAQKNNRETEARGIGWELFKNYLIAKEKFKPDYFLYENNKSAAQPIKDQISKELGVPLQYINSALVSAQNRQRFYAHNIPGVTMPEDKGILIKDILDEDFENRAKHYMPRMYPKENYVQFDVSGKGHNSQQDRAFYTDGKFGCLPSARANTKVKVCKRDESHYVNLSLGEVKRLQTVPDNYKMFMFNNKPNISMIMLGNGWTVEVIKHILSHIPNIKNEPIEVLSMYDGMSCGQITLRELGCSVAKYYSTEIDKYAIKTTQANFPDTTQLGDAFQVRSDDWMVSE